MTWAKPGLSRLVAMVFAILLTFPHFRGHPEQPCAAV